MSNGCDPCKAMDEAHFKRHREIAEKIHELKLLKTDYAPLPASPLTPKALNMVQSHGNFDKGSPMSKHERKEAKKARKVAEMAKGVTTANVEFIAKILHPEDNCDVDVEQQLLEDADIQRNLFFHKGTSNRRDVRYEFVKHDRRGNGKTTHRIESKEINGLLQLLDVSPITNFSTTEEKNITTALRKKIEEDLVQEQNEREQMLMRKAGFWRWASKKAYKRLVQNGKLWSERGHDILKYLKAEDLSNESSSSTGALDTETEITEPDIEMTAPSLEDQRLTATTAASASTKKLSTPGKNEAKPSPAKSDGWTMVGKTGKSKASKPATKMKLTFVHNGGLSKMVQSPTPTSNKFSPDVLGTFDDEETF